MATITIDRCCVACRKMIPTTEGSTAVALVQVSLKYEEKSGKLHGKSDTKAKDAICPECSLKFLKLVAEQREKGYKVV
jgi:hypothetical protein